MKSIVAKNGLLAANGSELEETVLLRFLRARKFEPRAGYEQLLVTETWRKEKGVAEIYDGSSIEEFVRTTKVHPAWTGRYDRTGKPVYLYKISVLTKEVIEDYDKVGEEKLQTRMIALYEVRRLILPPCTPADETQTTAHGPILPPLRLVAPALSTVRQRPHLQHRHSRRRLGRLPLSFLVITSPHVSGERPRVDVLRRNARKDHHRWFAILVLHRLELDL